MRILFAVAIAIGLAGSGPFAQADHHECCSPAPKPCVSVPKLHLPHWPVVGCRKPPANCIKAPVVKRYCPKPVKVCCPQPVKWCMTPAPTCCKPQPTCCAPKVARCPSTPSCAAPHGHAHDHDAHTHDKPPAPAAENSLYSRLGGEATITAVVEKLVARAAGNPKVNFTRKGTAKEWEPTPEIVEKLEKHLVELLCMSTGGPQKYTGRSMKEAHAGMQITRAEFDALASDLIATLDEFKVPEKEKNELVKIIAGTANDIIEKKKQAPKPPKLGK